MYTLKLNNIDQVRIINSVLGAEECKLEQLTSENFDQQSLERIFKKLNNSYEITNQTGKILRDYRNSKNSK